MAHWQKLGVIAGGGPLPGCIAKARQENNTPFHIIRLKGFADNHVEGFPGDECGIAEVGKIIRLLKANRCDGVVLAGLVQRPDFKKLKPDWRGAALLPKIAAAARGGDGALLNVLVETLEAEGFIVVGADEVTNDLKAPAGVFGRCIAYGQPSGRYQKSGGGDQRNGEV